MANSDRSALMPQKSNMPDLGTLLRFKLQQDNYNQRAQQSFDYREQSTKKAGVIARLKSRENNPAEYKALYNSYKDIGIDKWIGEEEFASLAPINVSVEDRTAQATERKTIDAESNLNTLLSVDPLQRQLDQNIMESTLEREQSDAGKALFKLKSDREHEKNVRYKKAASSIDMGHKETVDTARAEKLYKAGEAGYMQNVLLRSSLLDESDATWATVQLKNKSQVANKEHLGAYLGFGNKQLRNEEKILYSRAMKLINEPTNHNKADMKQIKYLSGLDVKTEAQKNEYQKLMGKIYSPEDKQLVLDILEHLQFKSDNGDNPSPFYYELEPLTRNIDKLFDNAGNNLVPKDPNGSYMGIAPIYPKSTE